MAKLENIFKKSLLRIMGTRWDVQSHEDRFALGIPDLSYGLLGAGGWIELKQIPEWPPRPETKGKPSKYTSEQVNWLRKRGKKAGFCFVLVRVGQGRSAEHFLFSWKSARAVRAGLTREEYGKEALLSWKGAIVASELEDALATFSCLPSICP